MNSVQLIGRLTRDPQVTYTPAQMCIARFTVAIDRGKDKNGESKGTDYPSVVCFGKVAEMVDKYIHKGRLVGVTGRIQTGSYDKDGSKVYTTDVIADRVEFLDKAKEESSQPPKEERYEQQQFPGFTQLDEDIPF